MTTDRKPNISAGTFSGNRALMLDEPLIFEIGNYQRSGVDGRTDRGDLAPSAPYQTLMSAPPPSSQTPLPTSSPWLGGLERGAKIGLPGLSEPEVVRHYTRLSRQNYAIDMGLFPLGSCTMKHNPRLNEKIARMEGFADIHPLAPPQTVQGALAVIHELAEWLLALTGMEKIAMSPKAGAHGELCGIMAIRAALDSRGARAARNIILVSENAHGTNPATAAFAGFQVENIPMTPDGRTDCTALIARLGSDIAGIMITNPNTCGLFERDSLAMASAVHDAGGYVYCDGANFNAIMGRVRPGDLGVDAMHINLHKTFSTPHGGGGPGAGPVVFSSALAPYAPVPFVRREENGVFTLIEDSSPTEQPQSFGRMTAFHGQMGMYTRALSYILSHGADGLRQACEDAVLNANYILHSLRGVLEAPFADSGPCMHEVLFSDSGLAEGFSTLDIAKGLIDEGYHPMTIYFPLLISGAMLIEPTESESKATVDQFIAALADVVRRAQQGDERLKSAPHYAPRTRLDETAAARKPILTWQG